MTAAIIDPRNQIRSLDQYGTEHHQPSGDGFRNIWGPERQPPLWRAAGWILSRPLRGFQRLIPAPVQALSIEEIAAPVTGYRVYWLGHACALIRLGDQWILTDPVFSQSIGPVPGLGLPRHHGLPLQPEALPRVDTVLISHDHYDHLDRESLLMLERRFRPRFFAPRGVGAILESWGIARVCEMDWWQYLELSDTRITCLPAKHFSGRAFLNRNSTLWASWAIEDRHARVYFGGDSGYGPHFREIQASLGPIDAALLPIGAYTPRWFMKEVHVDPAEALQAYLDLEAGQMLAIHWGCFDLADEGLHEPAQALRQLAEIRRLDLSRIHVLPVGGCMGR